MEDKLFFKSDTDNAVPVDKSKFEFFFEESTTAEVKVNVNVVPNDIPISEVSTSDEDITFEDAEDQEQLPPSVDRY